VEEVAAALQLSAADFRRRFHFDTLAHERPGQQAQHDSGEAAAVVVHSRACGRALWAAQLLCDAGHSRVLVYREGVFGWPFGGCVDAYPAYEEGCAPPEPSQAAAAARREPDAAAGVMELTALGLLPLLLQQHGKAPLPALS
jgi:rhodanese-related sulfurtransferase